MTENIINRLQQHNSGKNTSTRYGIPWEIKKYETYSTRAEAVHRESFIKRMKSRSFIEKVINGER